MLCGCSTAFQDIEDQLYEFNVVAYMSEGTRYVVKDMLHISLSGPSPFFREDIVAVKTERGLLTLICNMSFYYALI